MKLPTLAIVGTGPVALAVARRHVVSGGEVLTVVSRDAGRAAAVAAVTGAGRGTTDLAPAAAADVVVVAVRDDAVASVGAALSRKLAGDNDPLVVHTSGALDADELLADATAGSEMRVAGLHPLQSLPRPERPDSAAAALLAERLSGAHWFHEGDGALVANALVTAWGGTFHALAPGGKSLYHAGAAILSNHTVALFDVATQLFEAAGLTREDSRAPLSALLAGTTENLRSMGSPAALTGPISRGDCATVARHLAALDAAAPELVPQYVAVALVAVDVAVAKGTLDDAGATALRELLRR